jgi:hypothetical protein
MVIIPFCLFMTLIKRAKTVPIQNKTSYNAYNNKNNKILRVVRRVVVVSNNETNI